MGRGWMWRGGLDWVGWGGEGSPSSMLHTSVVNQSVGLSRREGVKGLQTKCTMGWDAGLGCSEEIE